MLVGLSAVVLSAVIAVVGVFLVRSTADFASTTADEHAKTGGDVLVTVGPKLPDLTRDRIERGLSPADDVKLDRAVASGQHQGVLSTLTIFNVGGQVLYSSQPGRRDTRLPIEPELAAAFRGVDRAHRHPNDFDPTTQRRTGVLDAFEPLRDPGGGRVYGAVEVGLPLAPVKADEAGIRTRILWFLLIGAVVLWLLLLPLTRGGARALAAGWDPARRRLLRDFRAGLDRGEIELVYQPQVDPHTGRIHAVEALVRWRRGGELVAPGAFLPVVEISPLMRRLTDRVIDLALAQLRVWAQRDDDLRISINLSSTDLSDDDLPERLARALREHAVPGSCVTVEITETAIVRDTERAQRVVEAITALGIDVAIDDFGTGEASLDRLRMLPIRELKIDQSFVAAEDERSRSYLAAIVSFAQRLELRVVAEGVETAAALDFLQALGCDLVQGFYIARPLSPEAISADLDADGAYLREAMVGT